MIFGLTGDVDPETLVSQSVESLGGVLAVDLTKDICKICNEKTTGNIVFEANLREKPKRLCTTN